MSEYRTKEIPYAKGYLIDTNGNVFNKKGKLLKPQVNGSYFAVDLPIGCGKYKRATIHRLVAVAFLENKDNKPQVNHKDGNKFNNNVDNLEWVTRSENMKHAYDVLLNSHFGERNTQSKLTSNDVLDIVNKRSNGTNLSEISSIYGISPSTICDIMSGRSWSHITKIEPKRNIKRMKKIGYI